jgi:hypothetical protein
MKTEKELREEVRRVRERVRELSGFWIGESAAAIYALEWALGKREPSPSVDLGRPNGGGEKIAAGLVKLAPKAAARPAAPQKAAVKPTSRPSKAKR